MPASEWRDVTQYERDVIREDRFASKSGYKPLSDPGAFDKERVGEAMVSVGSRAAASGRPLTSVQREQFQSIEEAIQAEARVLSGGPNGTSVLDRRLSRVPTLSDEGTIVRKPAAPGESCVREDSLSRASPRSFPGDHPLAKWAALADPRGPAAAPAANERSFDRSSTNSGIE
jgi:hypothetical protein